MPVKGLPSCSRQNTAAQDSIERASHPVHGGQSPIRPHNAEVGHKPMVHTQPTGQPRSAGNQSCTPHAVRARTAPRVLRPEAPGGSPSSGPSVPLVPTMATHTVGPASRGIMYKQNVLAQDLHHLGCLLSSPRRQPVLTTAPPRPVHKRRAQATSCRSSVPAISLLIQGALRARERGRIYIYIYIYMLYIHIHIYIYPYMCTRISYYI